MNPNMGEEQVLALALEGRVHAASGQTAELVALAGNLALLPDPEIDETWASALEARLLGVEPAAKLTLVEPLPAPEPLPTNVVQMPLRRFVVRRALAGAVAAAMLGAFPVVAVAGSLPGTPGYGVKRSVERLYIAMFGDAVEDGFAHAKLAQRRVGEASQLIALRSDPNLITITLNDAAEALRLSARLVLDNTDDPEILQRLSDVTRETQRRITALQSDAPNASQPALEEALDASIALQTDVARLLGTTPTTQDPVAVLAPVDAPAPSGQAPSTPRKTASKPTREVRDKVREEPTGTGKKADDTVRSCPVPGRDSTGDLLAPLARPMCDLRDATY